MSWHHIISHEYHWYDMGCVCFIASHVSRATLSRGVVTGKMGMGEIESVRPSWCLRGWWEGEWKRTEEKKKSQALLPGKLPLFFFLFHRLYTIAFSPTRCNCLFPTVALTYMYICIYIYYYCETSKNSFWYRSVARDTTDAKVNVRLTIR